MDPSQPDQTRLIIVVGPTGIGKTTAGIQLARRFDGEIISADSMQIYRFMDIGTAKPTPKEQCQAHHHLIDVADPDEDFDAVRFSEMARQVIDELINRGKIPIIVGGTGFYVKALLHGLYPAPPTDPDLRERLGEDLERLGAQVLHEKLSRLDPESAARIHPNDRYRLLRALETVLGTGQPLSAWHQAHGFPASPYQFYRIGLEMDRSQMYTRINTRVELMVREGLLEEVSRLLDQGFGPELKSMQSLGYRHMVAHLLNGLSWEETIRTMQRDTRHYAKRQLTWFKREPDTVWVGPGEVFSLFSQISEFLGKTPIQP